MRRKLLVAAVLFSAVAGARADNVLRDHMDVRTDAATGRASVQGDVLTIDYDFSGGGKSVGVVFKPSQRRRVESVALDFSCGVDVRLTACLVDSAGQTFSHTFGIPASEWEHAELNLSDAGWVCSGGAKDCAFRSPAASFALIADNPLPGTPGGVGRLRVRNVKLSETLAVADKGPFPPPLTEASFDEAMKVATNACAQLRMLVPQLEARGVGAKSRATLRVLESFAEWVGEDVRRGFEKRALVEAREMAWIGSRGVVRAEMVLSGREPDFAVPRYRTSKIEISHAQTIADRVWPDGHVDRGPVFFNGFGHFGLSRKDLEKYPDLGCDFLQMEVGPAWVMPKTDVPQAWALDDFKKTAERAAKAGVGVNLLISPHYWPKWAQERWPYMKECGCYAGYCPFDKNARELLETYIRFVVSHVRGNPALHSICLSNEPNLYSYGRCPRLRKAWARWLERRYETVEKMNKKLGTDNGAFADVPTPEGRNDLPYSPLLAEFIRFNRECFAAWHRWMADIVHEIAPEIPVHAKIQINPILWRSPMFFSIDPVAFGRLSQYNGNDAVDFIMDSNDPNWCHNWWWMEIGYDLQRSAADIPVANTENHIHPDRSSGTYLPGVQTYATLWQNALHGQNCSALWCWDRAYDEGKSDFNGLILERPECLEAYAHAALDLNRLADRLAPIQNLPPSVLVLYSSEVILRGANGAMMAVYRAANFLGQPLGVVTEEMLADYGRGGTARPFDSAKVILLPKVDGLALSDEIRAGLEAFKRKGGRVVVPEGSDDRALHGGLVRDSGKWRLPDYPVARDVATGLPAFGVETRGVREKDVSRLSLCNHSFKPIRVLLENAGVNLIDGCPTQREVVVQPLVPQFIELRTSK